MEFLKELKVIKANARINNHRKYVSHLRETALKEKRALTQNEYWVIQSFESEIDRILVKQRAGTL